ncbi:hypothetical protein [Halodesulfovibrio aestuarii]|uniref:XRE family transcriptional regulator n=1 Tax=Halodesulfovibrio aestuarii TaxID=126333 RepID=A0ABV4JW91_9BACT
MSHLTLIPEFIADLTRAEKLEIYMKRTGLTFADIAKPLNVAPASARRMLLNDSIPTWRHTQLIKAGIPEMLLPPARDIAPGRKPKKSILISTDDSEPNYLGQAA